MLYLLLFFVLLYFVLVYIINFIRDERNNNIPGPTHFPLLGSIDLFFTDPSEFLKLLHKYKKSFGDAIRIHMLSQPYIIISHPKYVEPILKSSELIVKGKSYDNLHIWLGNGLLTSAGLRWKRHRKFLTPAFHYNILQNFLAIFLKNEKVLLKKLEKYADGHSFDVFPIIALLALDNVTESIMGIPVEAQTNAHSEYVESIDTLTRIVAYKAQNPLIANDVVFSFLSLKKTQDKALKYLHDTSNNVIAKRRKELAYQNITSCDENEIGIRNKHAFLDLLLLAEVNGEKIPNEHIREEVDTFMFEGYDTTTSAVVFALYCLSKHPEIQQKILDEQKQILGDNFDKDPEYNEMSQMKYLDSVIKESLRIFPSVPMIERLITRDMEIVGLKIKKNTPVLINIFELQRHADLYDEPLEFRPERFDIGTLSDKNAFNWLAFSAGPRNCIGQKFAMLEIKVTIAGIIKHFKLLPSNEDPHLCAELIIRSKNGVKIRLQRR